ncbi:hypothetical protein CW731_10450 [Polaribacter sp. ALD11]|uniref:vitamin K epoxide reductase family protein n=1 Tax=Polaribacter sp. ALD11 TaxID=2058137 RepID=UPI000C311A8E|nr:vitamin K epoxide reductase family protein [Polaribacter sp. ALD11]AUC85680.1 hypothetical protein CW731_10450 [Polaribacter sp. ALD11]
MKNQLTEIISKLLSLNKISFDRKELFFQVQSHPSYPSLHAITGVLDHFNIENVAADVPVSIETLKQLPDCFIAQIIDDNGKEIVTVEKGKSNYTVIKGARKKEKLSTSQFIKKFTGIIVAVEKPEHKEVTTHLNLLNNNFLLIGLAIALVLFLFNLEVSLPNIFYFLLSLIGIFISIAIIKQELGLETAIGNAFCSGGTEKKDCDAVLTSKGAELLKGYKLSDFSLLYFIILSFLTLVQIQNPNTSFIISVIALPITIYSIYYQYFILKKWCLLCLTIVGVLWIQSFFILLESNNFYKIGLNEVFTFLIIATLTFLFWSFLKPILFEVNTLRKDKIKAFKFQRNFDVFHTMLNKSKPLETAIEVTNEVVFGNLNANLEIVVITNPFCGHCRPVHEVIENILLKYENEVKIIIRFYMNTENIENDGVTVTTRILEIYKNEGKQVCLKAMKDIYKGMETNLWLKKWEKCNEKEVQIEILKRGWNWCIENNINFTPELLINGKAYPKQYEKSELLFFIEDLIETN